MDDGTAVVQRDAQGRWLPGRSGWPHGRPRGLVSDALREIVDRRELAARLLELARAEDPAVALPAIKLIYERLDGKPAQQVTISGDADRPLPLVILPPYTQAG